jgi:IclR family acetate operon transcriptional repressor
MKDLASRTGETAHLAVRLGKQTLFVADQSSRNHIIGVSGQTGEFKPLYCTAHGKALVADLDLAGLKTIFGSEPFQQYTPQTIVSVEQLARCCAKIRLDGFAHDDAEFEKEVRCLAAPIRDGEGAIIASVGISAPMARFVEEHLAECTQHVLAVSREIADGLKIDSHK